MAVTVALFAAALAAMTSLHTMGISFPTSPAERVTWIPIAIPSAAPIPPPHVKPRPVTARPSPNSTDRTPSTTDVVAPISGATLAPPNAAPASRAPSLTSPPRVDTTSRSAPASSAKIPLGIEPRTPVPYTPRTAVLGAPIATAGVTSMHAPMTVRVRDSTIGVLMADVVETAGRGADSSAGRVHAIAIPRHDGGNGARICVCVSLPLPIFEPGPSAAQRKRDAIVAADNLARLNRLGDRLRQRRDSIRLDSLRRDSLAMKGTRLPPSGG